MVQYIYGIAQTDIERDTKGNQQSRKVGYDVDKEENESWK
jgi:hypothetical protein